MKTRTAVVTPEDVAKDTWIDVPAADLVVVNASLGRHFRLVPDRTCALGVVGAKSGQDVFVRVEQGDEPFAITADAGISGTTDFGVTATAGAIFFFHLVFDDASSSWEFVPGDQAAVLAAGKAYTDAQIAALSAVYAPLAHHARHEDGGGDEISVTGLSGVLADPQHPIIGALVTEAVAGNDVRLANARTPTNHASTHLPGGPDAVFAASTGWSVANPDDVKAFDVAGVALADTNKTVGAIIRALIAQGLWTA